MSKEWIPKELRPRFLSSFALAVVGNGLVGKLSSLAASQLLTDLAMHCPGESSIDPYVQCADVPVQ